MTLWGEKTEVAFICYTKCWRWTSSVPNRGITNMTNVPVTPSAISTTLNLLSRTAHLAAALSCSSQQECLSWHVSPDTPWDWFLLCFAIPHVPWPSSLTPWHEGLNPQALLSLWLSVRRHQPATLVVSQFSVFFSSSHRPPTRQVFSFSIYSPPNTTT